MVTLINHGSASAAEITAGALSDNGRSPLVGRDLTFGTGPVLTPFNLDDGSIVLLGTALLARAGPASNLKHGVTPDDEVTLPANADQIPAICRRRHFVALSYKRSSDPQLKAAYEKIIGKDFSADVR